MDDFEAQLFCIQICCIYCLNHIAESQHSPFSEVVNNLRDTMLVKQEPIWIFLEQHGYAQLDCCGEYVCFSRRSQPNAVQMGKCMDLPEVCGVYHPALKHPRRQVVRVFSAENAIVQVKLVEQGSWLILAIIRNDGLHMFKIHSKDDIIDAFDEKSMMYVNFKTYSTLFFIGYLQPGWRMKT